MITPFEDSPLYPWCLFFPDEIMRLKYLVPYCLSKRNYIVFARRCDMNQIVAISPDESEIVLEIHYQPGNKIFIDITGRFLSISEWVRNINATFGANNHHRAK